VTQRRFLPLRRIFLVPAVLAVLSTAGLAAALFGDDAWDVASWMALAIPTGTLGNCLFRAFTEAKRYQN
jgi:hypothetical protein